MTCAIILAGGYAPARPGADARQYEALLAIGGQPMVSRVEAVLAACCWLERIVIAGPVAALSVLEFSARTTIVASGATMLDSFGLALQALDTKEAVLVVTVDIPLVTVAAVEDFVRQARNSQADLCYPVVRMEQVNAVFPGSQRTSVTLREGVFTGGNVIWVQPAIVPRCLAFAEKVMQRRKQPWALCRLLGIGFLLRFLCGWLGLVQIERRLQLLLGIKGRVIISAYAELAVDADKASDIALLQASINRAEH